MGLTVTDVKEELTDLLRVTVADPKWSKTQLLELPIAERQFEASRQYGLRLAQANLNLAVCLLQSVNQLTPASPAPRFHDTWKMLIGASNSRFEFGHPPLVLSLRLEQRVAKPYKRDTHDATSSDGRLSCTPCPTPAGPAKC